VVAGSYHIEYNERGDLITLNRDSFVEKRSHDLNGHVIRRESTVATGTTLIETATFLQNGFLTNIAFQQIETDGAAQNLQMSFTPDAVFNVKQITYPGQKVRTYSQFDFFGRPHHMEIADYKEDYDFDRNGNLVKVTRDGTATDTFGYDGYDRLVTNKFAVNASTTEETTFEYYPNGEVSKRAVKDALGKLNLEHTYGIDSFGRVTSLTETSDSGPALTQVTYGQGSRTVTITSPANEQTTISYNAAGQMTMGSDSTRTITSWPGRKSLTSFLAASPTQSSGK